MRLRHTIYILFLLCIVTGYTHSQVIQVWEARENGFLDSIDVATAITTDNAGNTYVTGYSYMILNLLTDIVTVKYDSNGNRLWRSTYDHLLLFDKGKVIKMD